VTTVVAPLLIDDLHHVCVERDFPGMRMNLRGSGQAGLHLTVWQVEGLQQKLGARGDGVQE
jgi:hypothetical protein